MKSSLPVLLDTDIGSDIDDAVCLAYLLRQPRCELLGVTTVSGQPRVRASMADAVCRAADRDDVPIHSGFERGMVSREVIQPHVPQAEILPAFAHRPPESFEPYTAVEFMREQIRARPGEITLIGIGPTTNLALLFNRDPECAGLLKQLVLMCGVFRNPPPGNLFAEWNARLDPEATAALYRTPVGTHVSLGLDVTLQCVMNADAAVAAFAQAGGPLAVVAAATKIWARRRPNVYFHDPLTAAWVFKPELCTLERGRVSVEPPPSRAAGMTWFDPAADGPHQVALGVDAPAFFDEYFQTVRAGT